MFTDWMSFYNQARPAVGGGGAPMFFDWGQTAASGVPMRVVGQGALQGPPAMFGGVPMQVNSPGMVGAPMSVAPSTMGVRVGEGVVQSASRPPRYLPATITKEGVHLGGAPSSALQTITKEGVRVGEGAVQSAGRPPVAPGGAIELYRPAAAATQGGRAGVMNALRNAFSGARKVPTRGGGVAGIAGGIAGNMLDESQLLGGDESVANDTASKMLKWGGAGAALGSMIPGVGTVVGGLGGAAVGAGHEFLAILTRADWGARPAKQRILMTRSKGMFTHYTAGPRAKNRSEGISRMRSVQGFHQGPSRGWADFAYSFGVDDEGTIYEGRGWGVVGGHTQGHNSTSHAVVAMLNAGDHPTDAMLRSILWLHLEHDRRYGSGFHLPHRAAGQTACPGGPLTDFMNRGMTGVAGPPVEMAPRASVNLVELRRYFAAVAEHNLRLAVMVCSLARRMG